VQKFLSKISTANYSFSFGIIFAGLVVTRWSMEIIREMGRKPYEGGMIWISLGMALGFLLLIVAIDFLLAIFHLSRPIRSALWVAGVIGPYLGIYMFNEFHSPVWSHVMATFATAVVFAFGYQLEKRFNRS
jgi:hypothetical protein